MCGFCSICECHVHVGERFVFLCTCEHPSVQASMGYVFPMSGGWCLPTYSHLPLCPEPQGLGLCYGSAGASWVQAACVWSWDGTGGGVGGLVGLGGVQRCTCWGRVQRKSDGWWTSGVFGEPGLCRGHGGCAKVAEAVGVGAQAGSRPLRALGSRGPSAGEPRPSLSAVWGRGCASRAMVGGPAGLGGPLVPLPQSLSRCLRATGLVTEAATAAAVA